MRLAWAEGVRWFGAFDVRTGRLVRAELGSRSADLRVDRRDCGRGPARRERPTSTSGSGDAAAPRGPRRRGRPRARPSQDRHRAASQRRPARGVARVRRTCRSSSSGPGPSRWSGCGATSRRPRTRRTTSRATHSRRRSGMPSDAGLRPRLRHLAASAAGFARPEFRYDLVRIGAFAYGIRPAGGPGEAELGIRPISSTRRGGRPTSPTDRVTIDIGAARRAAVDARRDASRVSDAGRPRARARDRPLRERRRRVAHCSTRRRGRRLRCRRAR